MERAACAAAPGWQKFWKVRPRPGLPYKNGRAEFSRIFEPMQGAACAEICRNFVYFAEILLKFWEVRPRTCWFYITPQRTATYTATHCRISIHCTTLHHTLRNTHCNTHCNAPQHTLQHAVSYLRHHGLFAAQVEDLHHTAPHSTTLQHTATHQSTVWPRVRRRPCWASASLSLHHAAPHCNALATHIATLYRTCVTNEPFLPMSSICLQHTLQHAATHCNTLQHTASLCTTLHHTATHTATHIATHFIVPASLLALRRPCWEYHIGRGCGKMPQMSAW